MAEEILDSRVKTCLARGKAGHLFTNWSETYSCKPELYFEPETTDEIREVLLAARKLQKHVRVIGAGCSPSDLNCTSDYMIDLKKYKAVLEVDQELEQVTVQSGLKLTELHDVLDSYNLGFPNLGALSVFANAGIISTCVHGTGADYGILATHVVRLELMTADGEILECSRTQNKEVFLSVICGLGAVGIILSITWQCQKAFRLSHVKKSFALDEILEKLEKELHSCDHFKFLWYPHTDKVVAEYMSRTTKKSTPSQHSWFWGAFIGFYLLEFLFWISIFVPALIPIINKFYHWNALYNSKERVDTSYKVFNFDCLFKQYVTEWAIPREKTAIALRKLREWTETSGFKAHFPAEVRFVKADDFYMSPCYNEDMCFINIISYRPYNNDVEHDRYWDYYEKLMGSLGGKPHWAKAHKVTPAEFEKIYPMFNKYREICQKLDPLGMLRNENLERTIFGRH